MNIRILLFFSLLISYNTLFPQDTLEIADNTFKVSNNDREEYYYGFAKSDKLIFTFFELKNKGIKEVKITNVSNNSTLFESRKTAFEHKTVDIPSSGVYKFEFINTKLFSSRKCKFMIQRIPSSAEGKEFNTKVYWRTDYDTTYKTIVHVDTINRTILNKTIKVHSKANSNGNKAACNFNLPSGTISWSYDLDMSKPNEISLYLTTQENSDDFLNTDSFTYIKKINSYNGYTRMTNPLSGDYSFCMKNTNNFTSVTVSLKIKVTILEITKEKKREIASTKIPFLKN